MARLEKELQTYASELAQHVPGEFTVEAFYEFLRGQYDATVRHHGADVVEQMSDDVILKVLKSQVRELIVLKRIGKLMAKRDRI